MPAADKTPGTVRKKTIVAGPKAAPRTRRKVVEPSALERLQSVIVGSLDDDKAENVVTLDLEGFRSGSMNQLLTADDLVRGRSPGLILKSAARSS